MEQSKRNKLILVLGAIAALGPLSIDMYLPSFPSIAEDLGVDTAQISLTLTAYFIGISVGQLIYGPLIDRYGRKPPLIFGLILYIVASVACALADSLTALVVARLFLALGGSVGMVSARAIVRDLFSTREVARVFSSLILVMGLAPILAPALGGFLDSFLTWRYIFGTLTIIGVLLLILVHFSLEESRAADKSVSLKPSKVFGRYVGVIKNRQFLVFGIAGSLAMAGLFTYIASSPIVLIENLGFDQSTYTILFGINASAFILGSQINRFVLKKYTTLKVAQVTALVVLLASLAFVIYVQLFSAPAYLTSAFFGFFLLCFGFINPNTTALALEPFDKTAGLAAALVGGMRMAAGAIASALISFVDADFINPIFWIMGATAFFIVVLVYAKVKDLKRVSAKAA